ncbi:MAG: SRPBCC family protein [Pseudomonadota bacterium]
MKLHQTNDRFVRRALLGNAAFSLLTGLVCLAAPTWVASVLFTGGFIFESLTGPMAVLDLGIGLVVFAALVFFAARQQVLNLTWICLIIAADIAWVLLSIALYVFASASLTTSGTVLVLAVALVVAIFAVEQAIGAAIVYQGKSRVAIQFNSGGMVLTASLETLATKERAWQVVSDQEAYADVADNLSRVEILEGHGTGMVRQCTDTKGRSWRETCTRWNAGEGFAFRVHTDAPDYPYPIAELSGDWSLASTADGNTEIKMVFHVGPKDGVLNRLLLRLMAASFAKTCDKLLLRWVDVMEGRASEDGAERYLPLAPVSRSRLSST